MPVADRRSFLGMSVRGLAAALAAGPTLLGRANGAFSDFGFHPDTLFLTWQRDPTTTMTVQWVGTSGQLPDVFASPLHPTAAAVAQPGGAHGGLLASGPWTATHTTTRPFPYTDLQVFRAELTGLTPGTEYQFRIGSHAATYRFRTMPAKATGAISFVSGGDCGVNPHAAAVNVLAARQDPYFAVIGGDLAYDNGVSPQTTLGFLRNYSRYMVDTQGRLVPMLACVGNHEVIGGYAKRREAAPLFLSLFDGLFHDATYAALDFGDYLSLVLLDTDHAAPIGGEQTHWLNKALKDRADRPHLIAVNHVPAYPSYRPLDNAGAGNREHWVPLFERHNVDVVLEHHDHTFKRTHPMRDGHTHRHGIVYLGDGSWGQLRAVNKAEARPYLAASGSAYHVSLHRLEGAQRYHMALEESGRIVDVMTTTKRPRNHLPGGYRRQQAVARPN